MGPDGVQEVGEPRGRGGDPGGARSDLSHAGGEHDQRPSSGKSRRRGKNPFEAGGGGHHGDALGLGVVVAVEIARLEPKGGANVCIGEVEHLQVGDFDSSGPAADLEWVHPGLGEVAEKLGPRRLLLV